MGDAHLLPPVTPPQAWRGLSSNARRCHWLRNISSSSASASASSGSSLLAEQRFNPSLLSDDLRHEIELECNPCYFAHFSPPLSTGDFEQIRSILLLDSLIQGRERCLTGQPQLIARVLLLLNRNVKQAFHLVKVLSSRLHGFHLDYPVFPQFRSEICVFAFLLATQRPALCRHLEENSFDVVDLIDITSLWCLSLFSVGHFPVEFVERFIDVLLIEGAGIFPAVLLALFKTHEKSLLDKLGDGLFQSITDLPMKLSGPQVEEIFLEAERANRENRQEMEKQRKILTWGKIKDIPGRITFTRLMGGDEAAASEIPTAGRLEGEKNQQAPENPQGGGKTTGTPQRNSVNTNSGTTTPSTAPAKATAAVIASASPVVPQSVVSPSAPHFPSSAIPEPSAKNTAAGTPATPVNAAGPSKAPILASDGSRILTDADSLLLTQQLVDSPLLRQPSTRILDKADDEDSEAQPIAGPNFPSSALPTAPANSSAPSELMNSRSIKAVPPSGLIKYSELTDYQVFPCIYFEGYLLKARKQSKLFTRTKATGFFGHLHRRFFILQGHFLTYFKSHLYKKPSRDESLDVRKCTVSTPEHEFAPFCIQIDTPTEKAAYLLFTGNEISRATWRELLQKAGQAD